MKLNRFINNGIKENISLNKASNEQDNPQFADIDYVNFEDLSSIFWYCFLKYNMIYFCYLICKFWP